MNLIDHKKLYIAGPMTGYPEFNFPAFHAAATKLRAEGHEVVNPAEVNADTAVPWALCMRKDLREMLTCDAIVALPGWGNSHGATLELRLARKLAMPVFDFKTRERLDPSPPVLL